MSFLFSLHPCITISLLIRKLFASAMGWLQRGQVETFMNITGASEGEAREKLQAFRGDINAAIDSYLSEKENSVGPVHVEEADISDLIDEEENPLRPHHAAQSFYPLPSSPSWSRMSPSLRGFGFEGNMAPRFPNRETPPFVTQPRDVREIPIDWKGEESRVRSSSGLVIEEIPATSESSVPSQVHPHFVSEDEEVSRPFSATFQRNEPRSRSDDSTRGSNLNTRQRRTNIPLIDEVMDVITIKESNDIEDEMLKAALEASKKETTRRSFFESTSGVRMHESRSDVEEDDFEQAVSLSLKTADEEQARREGKDFPWLSEFTDIQDRTAYLRRESLEESKEEQSSPRRSSSRLPNSVPGLREELWNMPGRALDLSERNSEVPSNDDWGGLSSDEKQEAAMLEAVMFGPGIMENAKGGCLDSNRYYNEGPLQRPPSPSVIAQRLLREQQDDEYIASLVADREKEERAQCEEEVRRLKEVEAKAAVDNESLLRENGLQKRLTEQEMEKQKAAKLAALPKEPSVDNENAVAIMVRLPDGARQGRRFLKSEPLQCLLDFIDVSCGPLPGPYQLVRPFPRRTFNGTDHGSSFHDLGLTSKYETLFLEVM